MTALRVMLLPIRVALWVAGALAVIGATASVGLALDVHGWLAVRELGDAVIAAAAACLAFWLRRVLA